MRTSSSPSMHASKEVDLKLASTAPNDPDCECSRPERNYDDMPQEKRGRRPAQPKARGVGPAVKRGWPLSRMVEGVPSEPGPFQAGVRATKR